MNISFSIIYYLKEALLLIENASKIDSQKISSHVLLSIMDQIYFQSLQSKKGLFLKILETDYQKKFQKTFLPALYSQLLFLKLLLLKGIKIAVDNVFLPTIRASNELPRSDFVIA